MKPTTFKEAAAIIRKAAAEGNASITLNLEDMPSEEDCPLYLWGVECSLDPEWPDDDENQVTFHLGNARWLDHG